MFTLNILSFFLLGALISVLAGFFGIGGGFILTPTLLLIGFSPIEAITTSLFYSIGTSLSGIVAHLKMNNIYWKEGLTLGLSGIVATQLARPVVFIIKDHGWDDVVIPSLYIVLLSLFIYKMLKKTKQKISTDELMSTPNNISLKLIIIGLIAGFVSTTLGVGGGFIIVPLVISFLRVDPKKAVGTSLFAVLLIVIVGFASYAMTVSIDYKTGTFLVVGGLIGSQFGAKLTGYYENSEIKKLLALLYVTTLASVLFKLVHLNMMGLAALFLFLSYFMIKSIVQVERVKKQRSNNIG